jgi:hypothetical protein
MLLQMRGGASDIEADKRMRVLNGLSLRRGVSGLKVAQPLVICD